jgi:hypothetical protein
MRTRLTRLAQSLPFGRRQVTLYVDGSTVACPLRGDTNLETCLACAHLDQVEGEPVTRIHCQLPGTVPATASQVVL